MRVKRSADYVYYAHSPIDAVYTPLEIEKDRDTEEGDGSLLFKIEYGPLSIAEAVSYVLFRVSFYFNFTQPFTLGSLQ